MLGRHLEEINRKYSSLYNSSTRIIPYQSLRPFQQIPFDEKIVDSVYGVMFTTDKIMYVCLEKEKLIAFDLYMQKGAGKNARAYFLTY
ncbi:hypothetical protein EDD80_10492 [Anseongella ginsenosidimutans]|uniref:Uncharacterized protein n=2 Tax=Anseongella ginsenosidimutans TaxID=496056 RepID=A0A4R3KTV3_9SPHI|nr:hypothetical protein EDD80_10492 [Anseongella ginsenosidimutans]